MNSNRILGSVFVVAGLAMVLWLGHACSPLPKAKVRASRVTAVNSVSKVTFTLTNLAATNTSPGTPPRP